MTTLQNYKPLPDLDQLQPGYEPGWKYGVLLLMAEPEDRVGSIILAEATKNDEKYASTLARVVAVSPTAFRHGDWEAVSDEPPCAPGDIVLTKRYPAGLEVVGADGRRYLMTKDEEIVGRRDPDVWVSQREAAA